MNFELAPTRDGTRLAYTLHGDKNAKNRAVLVHSLAMDREFWRPVAERLAAKAAVLTYDCRGHGASDKPDGPYTVELFADDLADLLDHVGWPSALVAGASMGGMRLARLRAIYPERTAALGLDRHHRLVWRGRRQERGPSVPTRRMRDRARLAGRHSRPRAGSATPSAPSTRTS